MEDPYRLAQRAIADLKSAVHYLLQQNPKVGLRNADIGRLLGIYSGHVGHEEHISRSLLAMMENEGVIQQDAEKRWTLRSHPDMNNRDE